MSIDILYFLCIHKIQCAKGPGVNVHICDHIVKNSVWYKLPFKHLLPITGKLHTMVHSPSIAYVLAPRNAIQNAQNAHTHLSKQSTAKTWNENKAESSLKVPSVSLTSAKLSKSTNFLVNIAFFDADDSPRQMNLSNFAQNEPGLDDGYDSEGDIGPFYDCIKAEGKQDYDEDGSIPEYFG
jgi:hypothetical protein